MRKLVRLSFLSIVSLVILAAASPTEAQEADTWVVAAKNKSHIAQIRLADIGKSTSLVRLWAKLIKPNGSYTLIYLLIDCPNNTYGTTKVIDYSREGISLEQSSPTYTPDQIAPDSMGEGIHRLVCA